MISRSVISPRRSSGFTLIELMVVVAVVTILVTIAVASYSSSIRKSRRTDAKTALLDLAGREQQFYTINNAYTNLASDLGYGAAGATFPITVGSGYYQVDAPVVTLATPTVPATFSIKAEAIGTQVNDTSCLTFTITNTGQQSSTGGGTDCW